MHSRNEVLHLTLQLPVCTSHMAFSRVTLLESFLRVSRKIALIFIACLILQQLNTKLNTIKSHKIQVNKLMQLQHFLLWNKTNIKYSCKSQFYTFYREFFSGFTYLDPLPSWEMCMISGGNWVDFEESSPRFGMIDCGPIAWCLKNKFLWNLLSVIWSSMSLCDMDD